MSIQTTAVLIQGEIGWDFAKVEDSDTGSSVDIMVTLLSSKYKYADIALEYRVEFGQEWKTDALLSFTSSGFIMGNVIRGAECSDTGSPARIRWEYLDNSLSHGTPVDLRLKVIPSPYAFAECMGRTYYEAGSDPQRQKFDITIPYKAVGVDSTGNFICVEASRMVVVDREGTEVLSVGGLSSPAYACEKEDGHFIIVNTGSDSIIEVDENGSTVKTWSPAATLDAPKFACYDHLTGNLLVTGGNINKAYEVSWSGVSYGTVLWSFGTAAPGSDLSHLSGPCGISYNLYDRTGIVIADSGNNRVIVVDRSGASESVSEITYFLTGGVEVPFSSPSWVFTDQDGNILVAESEGALLSFSEVRSEHPTLTRYSSVFNPSPSLPYEIVQYRNLVFSPVAPAVTGGATT